MAAPWTETEKLELRECFAAGVKYSEAAAKIGKSRTAVRHKAVRMGIMLNRSTRKNLAGDWTAGETETLRELAGKSRAPEIARQLGRTLDAVYGKMQRLGIKGHKPGNRHLKPGEGRRGTPEQQAKMRELAEQGLGSEVIARQMGITGNTVRRYASRLGITMRARIKWTPEDDHLLRVNAHRGIRWTADVIGRTVQAVESRSRSIGVSFVRERMDRRTSVATKPKAAKRVKVTTIRKPALRQRPVETSRIDWCVCGAPVSNWAQHHERLGYMGHERRIA